MEDVQFYERILQERRESASLNTHFVEGARALTAAMAGCIQATNKTKTNTRLSFQHNAQALSAENTGAEDVGE